MIDKTNRTIILLPSYQPEETLFVLSKGLNDLGFKVLIVDDGSGENYKHIFDRCKDFSTVISYEENKGKGFALKTGFKYALDKNIDVNYVITADGDGQHTIQDIVKMHEKAVAKNVTIIGERHFEVKTPFKSRIGNAMSRFTQALCTYRYMRDNQCGLREFPTSLLSNLIKISGNRYEYEMNVLTYLMSKEIPFITMRVKTIYEDNNRTTHFRPFKDTLLIQSSILKCGLINLFTMIIGIISSVLLYFYVFSNIDINYELSILVSSAITFGIHSLLNLLIYKPKNVARMIFRVFLYEFFLTISLVLSITLFCRICNFEIYWAYLLSYFLMLIPIYYLIKGIGLVYSSQYE